MKKFAFLILSFLALNSRAADYQIDSDNWRFDFIVDTCPQELEEAIGLLDLPAGTVITYPETIGYEYFKIQFTTLGSKKSFAYEFRYWTDSDRLVCERVDVEGLDE